MGRKNKYETHVLPKLDSIREWIVDKTEAEICDALGISERSLERYKVEHEELREALSKGRQNLITELKKTMRRKAFGFHEKETKTTVRIVDGKKTQVVEEFDRYYPPDLGAIHLLLKNLDPNWRNDDQTTIDLKKEKLQLEKERAESNQWS